jgi:hypothetical protein
MRSAAMTMMLSLAVSVFAGVRYGSATDLRGAKTFYVDTGGDLKTHDDLVNRIGSKLPLTIVGDEEKADLVVEWHWAARNCAKASVRRQRDDNVYVAWSWSDCGSGWTSAQYLFVFHFSRVFEKNNN